MRRDDMLIDWGLESVVVVDTYGRGRKIWMEMD